MTFLDPGSERVVRSAVGEFLQGALGSEVDGELVLHTDNSTYRFIDGVCFGAADDDYVGAELVGWLLESERSAAVSAWWRRDARAVLVLCRHRGGPRPPEIVVTSAARALTVNGRPARDGFATQQARFVVVRDPEPEEADEAIDVDLEETSEHRPIRASTPDDRAAAQTTLMRLPTTPLPLSPEVERILGPRVLPAPSLPPPRGRVAGVSTR